MLCPGASQPRRLKEAGRRLSPCALGGAGDQRRNVRGCIDIERILRRQHCFGFEPIRLGLDFLGDAANYAISLLVVGMALRYRASAALAKGATMAAFGLWVIGTIVWHALHGTLPSAFTMGTVGVAALVANAASFGLLWAYRHGDANMRSAWICTRNDVFGNLAVLVAALGVFGTGTGWPDTIVAAIMAMRALQGATLVIRRASTELRFGKSAAGEQPLSN